jgi:hypothetical protein
MAKKALLIAALVFCMGATNCGTATLGTKLYRVNDARGGLYRGQSDELIPYPQADGYYCMSPDDMRKVVEFIAGCR